MDRPDPLESLKSFKSAVGEAWYIPLANIIESPKFESLYNYVSKEYTE